MLSRVILCGLVLCLSAATPPVLPAKDAWYPVSIESRQPPFNSRGFFTRVDYVPGERASQPWRLCASIPDLELAYFQAVAHGLEAEARRQGVTLRLENVGGFDSDRQRAQLEACLEDDVDGLLVVAAASGALDSILERAMELGLTVIDVANGSGSRNVTARIVPDTVQVGWLAGRYLVDLHPLGTETTRVAWIPGPPTAAFAQEYDRGFRAAIRRGALTIARDAFTALDRAALRGTVREILAEEEEPDVLAGVSVAMLTAMDLLGDRAGPIALVSTGINPAIVAGIEAGRIAATVNDKPVIQGRIAVDLAVRALEGVPFMAEIRPSLEIVDQSNVDTFERAAALAPPE